MNGTKYHRSPDIDTKMALNLCEIPMLQFSGRASKSGAKISSSQFWHTLWNQAAAKRFEMSTLTKLTQITLLIRLRQSHLRSS